jgi:hypothetical protein
MATWIILAGALILALILGGAVLVVMIATRERTQPVRIPGVDRIINRGDPTVAPVATEPTPDPD